MSISWLSLIQSHTENGFYLISMRNYSVFNPFLQYIVFVFISIEIWRKSFFFPFYFILFNVTNKFKCEYFCGKWRRGRNGIAKITAEIFANLLLRNLHFSAESLFFLLFSLPMCLMLRQFFFHFSTTKQSVCLLELLVSDACFSIRDLTVNFFPMNLDDFFFFQISIKQKKFFLLIFKAQTCFWYG